LIDVKIPGRGVYKLEHLILDLNGTLSLDGRIIEGVPERLNALRNLLDILIVTADTQGTAKELGKSLKLKIQKLKSGNEKAQKLDIVQQLGKGTTVSIGNGSNDARMLGESALGICVLGSEGASRETLSKCDIVVSDINAALDLLIKPKRLIATLRK
jgi:P-type E1-E2 ATPase